MESILVSSLDRIERGSKRYKSKGSRGINIREFTKHDRERAVLGESSLDRIERGSKRYKSKGSSGINISEFTRQDREGFQEIQEQGI